MAVHVETTGPQQDSVRRSLNVILPHIDKDLCGIELRLVLILSYTTDEVTEACLKQVAIKNSHFSRNIKTHEIEVINNIDYLIPPPGQKLLLEKSSWTSKLKMEKDSLSQSYENGEVH